MNAKEQELLEAVGSKPAFFHVIVRHPWSIVFGRRAYLPGLLVGLLVFGLSARQHDALASLAASAIAGVVLTVCLLAHEAGHLLFSRLSRGVKPRMLVLSAGGGISIVEGRHEEPRGAALFAAGGPIGSLTATFAFVAAGLLLPVGPFSTALFVPAALTFGLTAINLLPLAPMDGYLLFRSWLWSNLGSRAEAERRAIEWSRVVNVCCLIVAVVLARWSPTAGFAALALCTTFVVQHHKLFNRVAAESKRG